MSLDEKQRAGVFAGPSRTPMIIAVLVILAAAGGGVWYLLSGPRGEPAAAGNSMNASGPAADGNGGELLPSGLRFETIREGNGPLITRADAILVRYETRRPNGPVLDGNMDTPQGAGLTLNHVGPGFAEALNRMRPGGIARIRVTARMFYGERLPPNGPFRPDDMLDALIRIEQVVVGRGAELDATGTLADNNMQANMVEPAEPRGRTGRGR